MERTAFLHRYTLQHPHPPAAAWPEEVTSQLRSIPRSRGGLPRPKQSGLVSLLQVWSPYLLRVKCEGSRVFLQRSASHFI